jgi:multiple antibiotic resistance protein
MQQTVQAFLLGFSALFSIVNPPSAAFIFWDATSEFTDQERARLARRVATYALVVMLAALWAGAYILEIFGLTVAALRVAGGLVVAASAWGHLVEPQRYEARKAEQASAAGRPDDIAFFPLTLPITAGPGTISVAIALSASHPPGRPGYWEFFLGVSIAAVAMALVILASFHFADGIASRLGKIGRQTVTRLAAFLLLCIGVQILIGGVEEVIRALLRGGG